MKRDIPPAYTASSASASGTNEMDHHSDTSSISDLYDGTHTPSHASTTSSDEHASNSPIPPAYNPTVEPSFFEQDHKQTYVHTTIDQDHIAGNNCFILAHLPAVLTTSVNSGLEIKLSSLAAGVLLKSGKLEEKDLSVYTPPPTTTSTGPTDPISGALIATHTIVSGVLKGVADYPILLTKSIQTSSSSAEVGEQFGPFNNPDGPKGVSRIVGTALSAPMHVTVNVAKGFENLPKVWGDEGRGMGEVKGVRDGFTKAGMGLGYGLYDGITGIATQPFNGYQKSRKEGGGVWGGVLGGVIGFGKGIGGVVCKPAAGALGLPAYAFQGIYEGVSRTHEKYNLLKEGEKGAAQMGQNDRQLVIVKWEILLRELGEKFV